MAADVTVRYWAGAQRAAGRAQEQLSVESVADLRARLAARPELAALCAVASFLVDGQQTDVHVPLRSGAVVDLLPPFAGG